MTRMHTVLGTSLLGLGAMLASVPANATSPLGYYYQNDGSRGTNCACAPLQETATPGLQAREQVAKQSNPGGPSADTGERLR
jgi:hypothetical protein